ncbi:hypothetical protein [Lactiplantibacillus paraxiangfangensis]
MTNSELVEQAWAGQLFFSNHRAGNVVENMQNVADSIMAVSNDICPED